MLKKVVGDGVDSHGGGVDSGLESRNVHGTLSGEFLAGMVTRQGGGPSRGSPDWQRRPAAASDTLYLCSYIGFHQGRLWEMELPLSVSVDVFAKAASHCLSEVAFGTEVQAGSEAIPRERRPLRSSGVHRAGTRLSPSAVNVLLTAPEWPKSLLQHSATE